jgi:ubiquinone/menaquinone biosynthesis C-methylase UbiE
MLDKLYQRYYFSRPNYAGGTEPFRKMISQRVRPGGEILEIGAGPSNPTSEFLSSLGRVVGLDISDEVQQNRFLAEARKYDGNMFPFPDSSFNACVSDYVLEHLADPVMHFKEVARVLRPGGAYCFRTVNLLHYIYRISNATPMWFHRLVARQQLDRDSEAYPTHYRANTARRLKDLATSAGLQVAEFHQIEAEPSYAINTITFFPMMWYERLVNSTPRLAPFRAGINACVSRTPE